MSARNILIILLVVVLLIIFYNRNRGNFFTYELKGKVTVINNCNSNILHIDDEVEIDAVLHLSSGDPEPFPNETFDAPDINQNTRQADYELDLIVNRRATKWEIQSITAPGNIDFCSDPRLVCRDNTQRCENRSTITGEIPIPSGTTSITQDFTITCTCITPQPTDAPATPAPSPEPTEQPDEGN